jgi:hypothetical protein
VALGAGICPHVLGDANTGISPFLMPTKRWASMRAVFRSASRPCSRNALRFENGSSYKVDDARARDGSYLVEQLGVANLAPALTRTLRKRYGVGRLLSPLMQPLAGVLSYGS